MVDLNAASALAERLADAAGAILRSHFRSRPTVEFKPDSSPVTAADCEAEVAMREILAAEVPDHGIIGEEYGADRPDAEFVWVLDPVDGTQAFIAGAPTFTTLIALLHRERPVLGVIDQPILRERWRGRDGMLTTFNGVAVHTGASAELPHAVLSATTPEMFHAADAEAFARLREAVRFTRFGLDGYAYALLASGYIDVVMEARLKPYDYCALAPVVAGAGGRITDWRGEPLGLRSDGRVLAAGDARTHAAALAVLTGREGERR